MANFNSQFMIYSNTVKNCIDILVVTQLKNILINYA